MGIHALQRAKHRAKWPYRNHLNPVSIRDEINFSTRFKRQRLANFFGNNNLEFG